MSDQSALDSDRYAVQALITKLLDELGIDRQRSTYESILGTIVRLANDRPEALNLKIVDAALAEMTDAFEMFQPFVNRHKVTIFGSARTRQDDPLYAQASNIAGELAGAGYMCITGAGPGIMQAAMEGAGREMSIGVSIRLPFEQGANPVIEGDHKYVSMKYFFTRKLMLIKESRAFVCLPGGFGTLDELFELITLTQTGKGVPVPIVLLDLPGDPYWERLDTWVREELMTRGLISPPDADLYLITDSCAVARDEILRFYANYDSMRFVGNRLTLRMQRGPNPEQLVQINERFAHLVKSGEMRVVEPSEPEVKDDDRLGLARVAFRFTNHGYGDLRNLIDEINTW